MNPRGSSNERLIIFTRYPEPGKTKTRLIPRLGAEGSAELQRELSEHTLHEACLLRSLRQVALEVRYDGGSESLMRKWLGEHLTFN